jgi:hypothetical protein
MLGSLTAPLEAAAVRRGAPDLGRERWGLSFLWALALIGCLLGLKSPLINPLAVGPVEQRSRQFPWIRSRALRALLALRALEVLAVAVLPTVWTLRRVASVHFSLSDRVALIAMTGLSAWLALQVWQAPGVIDKPNERNGADAVIAAANQAPD